MKIKIISVLVGILIGVFAGWYVNQNEKVIVGNETIVLEVFFGNSAMNPNSIDCNKVFPVEREVSKTEGVARVVLQELFNGPTVAEEDRGYNSLFSEKTSAILKNVKVQNGIAYVDLYDVRGIIPNASASCGSAHFLASIHETLKQFPTVRDVRYAINGDPAVFYDWMQFGCNSTDTVCDPTPFK
ncbi:MAG: GerMN domain-containing protein [Candidatus Jorgensenbacteria bacterium]|nr:GerMN domain-containing protein [Candidatus Jorgensenbacteria bacterium]